MIQDSIGWRVPSVLILNQSSAHLQVKPPIAPVLDPLSIDFEINHASLGASLVSRFRSSHVIDIGLGANFETKTTPGFNELLVSLDPEIRREPDMEIMRISGSGH